MNDKYENKEWFEAAKRRHEQIMAKRKRDARKSWFFLGVLIVGIIGLLYLTSHGGK
jgi:hypothetical protein